MSTNQSNPAAPRTVEITLPTGWSRALVAGVEAAVAGWLIPVAFAVIGLFLTSANPWVIEVDLSAASHLGADIWALSLGGHPKWGELSVSLMPLGLTLLLIWLVRLTLSWGRLRSRAAVWFVIPSYVLTAIFLDLAAVQPHQLGRVIAGATVVAAVGAAISWRKTGATVTVAATWQLWLRGVKDGLWGFCWLFLAANVAAVALWAVNFSHVRALREVIGQGTSDKVMIFLGQLAYLPNAASWVLAWVSGQGFYLGADNLVTPGSVSNGPVPALPWLGLVPATPLAYPWWLSLVAIGLGLGFWWSRRARELHISEAGLRAAVALGCGWLATTAWLWLAGGALGSARLARLGPVVFEGGLVVVSAIGFIAAAVMLGSHPSAKYWFAKLWGLAKGRAQQVVPAAFDPSASTAAERDSATAPTEPAPASSVDSQASEAAANDSGADRAVDDGATGSPADVDEPDVTTTRSRPSDQPAQREDDDERN